MDVSRVHSHGPNEKYLRVVIPISISQDAKIKKGTVVAWEILDGTSMILKVVGV